MMRGRNLRRKSIVVCALAICLYLSGCGEPVSQASDDSNGSSAARQEESTIVEQPTIADNNAMKDSGKEIITLGTCRRIQSWDQISKSVTAFNQSQNQYTLELKQYDNCSQFALDIARKQGCDLFDLCDGRIGADIYAVKGVLEDLTPYFESSDVVSREAVLDSVWRAGSIDGKMFFVIPAFRSSGILVEKDYITDGGWTGEEYIALADRYPESMLNKDVQSPTAQIFTYLNQYVGNYIDWEKRTCSFDGREFVELLEKLKELSTRSYKTPEDSDVESVRNGVYLTYAVTMGNSFQQNEYKDLKDAFFDAYVLAGVPTADGTLRYDMFYQQMYGMNAEAGNKKGAWAFLEYLLSEEYQQTVSPDSVSRQDTSPIAEYFPARKDVLEKTLQENLEYEPEADGPVRGSANKYTKEITYEYRSFQQEDRNFILKLVENSYREAFLTDQIPLNLIKEEAEPFFEGQKSAADVAKIIQSRVSLYLSE